MSNEPMSNYVDPKMELTKNAQRVPTYLIKTHLDGVVA